MSADDSAQARSRRHHRAEHADRGSAYAPPYAAIVVDANSGRVLYASSPDSLRHPASITKIMTLYLLFEQIEAGKLRLDSRLSVSGHAAAQEPSKLGLEPGQTISVEDAIKAVVTKSANDIAVVIAEAIGGTEQDFARLMTRKAHALGMTRTVYVNASGLPDDEQVTTVRDQALLGRAVQDRFPRFYRYFATSSFHFHGMDIRNHNHLLGRIQGVDGIKTGYTRASGFNLVTSVHRGGRHVVAVVFGGSSGAARDARMRNLIEEHIAEASNQRTVPMIAEAIETDAARAKTRVAAADPEVRINSEIKNRVDAAAPASAPAAVPQRAGSAEPIQPIPVKTINVRARLVESSGFAPLVTPAPQANTPPQWTAAAQPPAPQPSTAPQWTLAAQATAPTASAAAPAPSPAAQAAAAPQPDLRVAALPATEQAPLPAPPGARPGILGTLPVRAVSVASEPAPANRPAGLPAVADRTSARGGWMIQLGAFADETEAKQRLRSAQSMAHDLLGKADGFTERVVKGSKELYRARFAGFDKDKAEAACHYFKRNDIACMTLKN